ncbi:GAF and ANTAR domain-containing protein [Arthrobacter sp. ov118]|uniref:GAF and ANTAR domain-containing protein n=1 Tax=Arthrobacter sp. ov118 TaxID=1761747 RepID=UPI0015A6C526|nr:GAF and ANTAR domain-containing protein [Arthrobacter sp. ov118]
MADELPEIFARVSGLLLTEPVVDQAVAKIAQAAHQSLAGSVGAGGTLIDAQGRPTSTASTNSLVEEADRLQYELGDGPCLSAWASARAVRVDDLRDDQRWPEWGKAGARLGLLSCISVPLLVPDATGNNEPEPFGAMKVYSDQPHAFDERSEEVLSLLAGPAALILANLQARERAARLSVVLKDALHSRSVIDQAKGVLMERLHVTERGALQVMITRARAEAILLSRVAQEILDTTEIDLTP